MPIHFLPFRKLFSPRRAVTLAALLVVLLPLGCMGLQLGHSDDGLVQEGEVNIQPKQEVDVYFATPYAGAPELEAYWPGRCEITEVKDTHFRVRNNGGAAHKLAWKASGIAAMVPPGQRGDRRQQVPPAPQPDPSQVAIPEASPPPVTMGAPR
jgi:hypothetical protein